MNSENGNSAHHEALLGSHPGSYAIVRHVRMSPMRIRRVVNLIHGVDVPETLTALKFVPQAASRPAYKVVASAVASAKNTEDLDSRDLYVSEAFVDEGVTLYHIRPRAKGSASWILKHSSHVTVVVGPRESKEI